MIQQLLATKSHMTQAWTASGVRIPVTIVNAANCTVVDMGKKDDRIVMGQGVKKLKNVAKPQRAQLEKNNVKTGFVKMREIVATAEDKTTLTPGTVMTPSQVFHIGDIVKVTGVSKGKGFTGVVKRHGFKGGPRTHGQSDRERAPGSIGSGTTPGRVYRNKRMAGRAGNEQVTTLGLTIVGISDSTGEIMLKGIVPGARGGVLTLTKTGESIFEGLLNAKTEEVKESAQPAEATSEQQA
ncbi:50S ribosomal protein L3 [Candidatus Cerribacteria bacterium 'Amazon FNV 2010 28 9']|uniref:50S ribosomal protein L3 n=1 Tax=Candidatus Cerribacteria bacterium 'Amazon FNV 2010 28 9' TaxID=2081795 RepID=A0A317JPP2_9BACT|nr:MAG: 50S ribosomal protein L3 [Candidatus Cerribacteria bacterium 'Amazon FNV 2010 28 9']